MSNVPQTGPTAPSDHNGSTLAPTALADTQYRRIELTPAQQRFVRAQQEQIERFQQVLKAFLGYVVEEAGEDPAVGWALVGTKLVPQQSLKPTPLR